MFYRISRNNDSPVDIGRALITYTCIVLSEKSALSVTTICCCIENRTRITYKSLINFAFRFSFVYYIFLDRFDLFLRNFDVSKERDIDTTWLNSCRLSRKKICFRTFWTYHITRSTCDSIKRRMLYLLFIMYTHILYLKIFVVNNVFCMRYLRLILL